LTEFAENTEANKVIVDGGLRGGGILPGLWQGSVNLPLWSSFMLGLQLGGAKVGHSPYRFS